MEIKLGETVYFDFVTTKFSTGAAFNATSTPTIAVYENDGASSVYATPTCGQISTNTGEYRATIVATEANGFEAGKTYNVWASATVDGVAGKGVIGRFIVRAVSLDNLATNQASIIGYIDTEIESLTTELAKVPKSDSTVTWNATALASINAQCDTAIVDGALATASNLAAVKADTAAILLDTGTDGVVVAAGSKTGYTLTATTGLGNQTADITGTVSTVTNLTNAPTNGDLTDTMKTSVTTAATAATPTAAAVTAAVTLPTIPNDWITAAGIATDAGEEIATSVWTKDITGTTTPGQAGALINDIDAEVDVIHTAINSIAVTGSALSKEASAFDPGSAITVTGTYDDTAVDNGAYHVITATAGGVIDCFYTFNIGTSGVPSNVDISGYLKEAVPAGDDSVDLQVWRWDGTPQWETIHTDVFVGITTSGPDVTHSDTLLSRHVEAGVGTVKIRFYTATATGTTTTLNIDKLNIEYAESVSASIGLIKTQTDKLTFTGTDVKATLDGELVGISAAGVDAILDEAVDGALTLRDANKVLMAFLLGETTGAGTSSIVFQDPTGTYNRITLTVDANGNRTAASSLILT